MAETIQMGGVSLRFLQDKDGTNGGLDLFELTLQPDAEMPVPHYHDRWDETVYGLAGTTTFQVAGDPVRLGPGQSVFIRRGVVHGFTNDTREVATCLCVLTPGVLGPAYFREMASLLGTTPPDTAAMKAVMLRYGLIPVA